MKLTDTQLVLLSRASQRPDRGPLRVGVDDHTEDQQRDDDTDDDKFEQDAFTLCRTQPIRRFG